MQECQNLIVEVGTEELPPMSLNKMSLIFKEQMQEQLKDHGLSFVSIRQIATPRRIAVLVEKLSKKQPDQIKVKKGPALHLAFDANGQPTIALNGFLNSLQINLQQITKVLSDDQKTGLVEYRQQTAGLNTDSLIPEIIHKAISDLPSPKMQWGNGDHVFVRPVHWLLVLFGKTIVDVSLFGVKSGNYTYGHRFLSPQKIIIEDPIEYESKLESVGNVIPDFNKRKQLILAGIAKQEQILNAKCEVDEKLLEEVTAMVEYPVVLCATFAEGFLKLPYECLRSVMGHHQKSFPLFDKNQKLLPKFILISNMAIKDVSNIVKGNEKVMQARLQDAVFLYEQDLKTPLITMLEKLKTVVLEEKLGSMYDQSIRIQKIAGTVCKLLNGTKEEQSITEQAALFCKADLVSKMVLEFPELQGIIGEHYTLKQDTIVKQENSALIAQAIGQHYLPKFSEDQLPDTISDLSVAVAYRLNLLCGLFAVGKVPTGEKDPFALRRHALAVIRMLIEKKLSLNLAELFDSTLKVYKDLNQAFVVPKDISKTLLNFCLERLKNWYINNNVAQASFFNAVLASENTNLYDFDLRIKALIKFSKLEEFQSLANANKRVSKLLEKTDLSLFKNQPINPKLFDTTEESNLFEGLKKLQTIVEPLVSERKYDLVLQSLVELKPPIDCFFDKVMVMVPDQNIQQNRLNLLFKLRELFLKVADVAYI